MQLDFQDKHKFLDITLWEKYDEYELPHPLNVLLQDAL